MADFQIEKTTLVSALKRASRALDRLGDSFVRLDVIGDRARLVGSGFAAEWEETIALPSPAAEDGSLLLDVGAVGPLSKLPGDAMVRIVAEDGQVQLKSGRTRVSYPAGDARDYPVFDPGEPEAVFRVPGRDFVEGIGGVLPMSAVDDVRHFLIGVQMEIGDDGLHLVGTDGHRLGWAHLPFPQKDKTSRILSREGAALIGGLPFGKELEVRVHPNQVELMGGDVCLRVRTVEGAYPDWRSVIPADRGDGDTVDVNELRPAVERLYLAAGSKQAKTELQREAGEIVVRFQQNGRSGEEIVETDEGGDPWQVGLHARYLLEALAALGETDKARISVGAPAEAVVITAHEGGAGQKRCYVIMPVRS